MVFLSLHSSTANCLQPFRKEISAAYRNHYWEKRLVLPFQVSGDLYFKELMPFFSFIHPEVAVLRRREEEACNLYLEGNGCAEKRKAGVKESG